MRNFDDFLRDAPPELIDALLSSNAVDLENQLQQARYKDALEKEGTKQPGMIRGERGMIYAPSPLENIAATLRQAMGGQDAEKALQQMQANWLRKGTAMKALLEHARNVEEAQGAKAQAEQMYQLQQNAIPSSGYANAAPGSPMPSNLENPFQPPWEMDFPRAAIGAGGGGGEPGQSGPKHDFGPYPIDPTQNVLDMFRKAAEQQGRVDVNRGYIDALRGMPKAGPGNMTPVPTPWGSNYPNRGW